MEKIIQAVEYRTKNYIFEFKNINDIKSHFNDDMYEVGYICKGNYEEVLKIIYLKDCFNIVNGHCKAVINTSTNMVFIAVSDYHIDNWFNFSDNHQFKLLVCLMLHELGHFKNGDFSSVEEINDYGKRRNEALLNGKVMDNELLADKFAADEIGATFMISMLTKAIKLREKRNDNGAKLAIKELELRKKNLKK